MGKYKVMITYVEAGMGHIVSAEAIANALETYYPDEVEVERSYIFEEDDDPILKKHETYLVKEVKRSNRHPLHMYWLFFLQRILPPQVSLRLSYATAFRRVRKKLIATMQAHDPDMVFHTHFTPLHCALEAKRRGADYLVGVYDPDPNVHAWWDRRADLMAVNCPYAYQNAMKRGFRPDRTLLSRFVLRTKVQNAVRDKAALRQKYDLPQDNFTVVIAAGAYAEGHLETFATRLLQLDRTFTLLVIAGKNEKVYDTLSALAQEQERIDMRVYRFQPDAHELYGAADLFVTKAGPNAILDSVYMGTPILANFYASPIEQITKSLYIDTWHVGEYIDDADAAATWIQTCIDQPEKLLPYREQCSRFVLEHTGGEKMIADRIVSDLRAHGAPKADRT